MISLTKGSFLCCNYQVPLTHNTSSLFSFYKSRYVFQYFPSYCSYVRLCSAICHFHYYITLCHTHFPEFVRKIEYLSLTVSLLLTMDEATCPGWKEALLSMCFTSLATECQQQRLFLDAILFSGFISDLSRRADYRIIRLLANRKISKLSPQATQPRPTSYKRSHHPSQAVSLLLATDETTCPGWKVTLLSMCFTSLATESQQQRLLRGMTIQYIAQPTFGPGLNPWGVYYLTNVLPASATFRRVPVHFAEFQYIIWKTNIYIKMFSLLFRHISKN